MPTKEETRASLRKFIEMLVEQDLSVEGEQEEVEREQHRLAEEHADEVLANHYADRIRKIVLARPNKFFPKPKAKPAPRSKTH